MLMHCPPGEPTLGLRAALQGRGVVLGETAAAHAAAVLQGRGATRIAIIGGTSSSVSSADRLRPPTTTEPRPR